MKKFVLPALLLPTPAFAGATVEHSNYVDEETCYSFGLFEICFYADGVETDVLTPSGNRSYHFVGTQGIQSWFDGEPIQDELQAVKNQRLWKDWGESYETHTWHFDVEGPESFDNGRICYQYEVDTRTQYVGGEYRYQVDLSVGCSELYWTVMGGDGECSCF